MANKTDALYKLFPKAFQTKYNTNWKAIIEAIGEQDQIVADLVEEVRRQLFVNTATRPYLDRLAANVKVQRPRFVGMDDSSFREYIPVMSYVPKQVKIIIDRLLDLFYFKESTTAYVQTALSSPFYLEDGWELSYNLDEFSDELVTFKTSDFSDISNATADEIASAINRQIKNGFAISYEDSTVKETYVRIFTNTIGAKGSVRVVGGRANIGLQFEGFLDSAGNGSIASWAVQRTGDTAKLTYISGDSANLQYVQEGDVAIIEMPPTVPGPVTISGSFLIKEVSVSGGYFTFVNNTSPNAYTLYSQTNNRQLKFFRPFKSTIYKRERRAAAWEITPGEFEVEMPSSPPIVKRRLAGSAHINGLFSTVINRVSGNELEIANADLWPDSGSFSLNLLSEIVIKNDIDDSFVTKQFGSRFDPKSTVYSYTGITGSNLTGITPTLPIPSGIGEVDVVSGSRTASIYDIVVTPAHTFRVNDWIVLTGITPLSGLLGNPTGGFKVTEIVSPTEFKCYSDGDDGVINGSLGGKVRVERAGMAASGSKVMLLPAQSDTKILGPYMWDSTAQFVLSYKQAVLSTKISAGNQAKIINVGVNDFPTDGGYVIFGYGTNHQEGPVRYFYRAPDGTMYINPSYTFNTTHPIGTAVSLVSRFGAHIVSTTGAEYSGYNTDASVGRQVLEDLITSVKSAGVFVNFIVRYPSQLYSAFDVYKSGIDPDVPVYKLARGINT